MCFQKIYVLPISEKKKAIYEHEKSVLTPIKPETMWCLQLQVSRSK